MAYPGNAALSPEVQQRLQDTFEQTLALAESGERQEAVLGCEFILQLDADHAPARVLLDRLRGGGPVSLDDLRDGGAGLGAAPGWDDLPPLGDDALGGFADLPPLDEEIATPPAGALQQAFRAHFAARRFRDLLELAGQNPAAVAADPELRRLAEEAQAHAEAEPYVQKFLLAANNALAAGNDAEVDRMLAKVSALDPGHPGIAEIEAMRGAAAPAPPDAAGYIGREVPDLAVDLGGGGGVFDSLEEPSFDLGDATSLPELSFADLDEVPGVGETSFAGLDAGSAFTPPAAPAAPEASFGALGTPSLGTPSALPSFGALDLSTPAPSPAEGDSRVTDLLNEGQAAFDGGDYQGAIDAWSRIFLIDIDHPEAARRIDAARKGKAEVERRAEESFHEGLTALEAGDTAAAKQAFEATLQIQPGHVAARDYLDEIASGRAAQATARAREAVAIGAAPEEEALSAELKEEILVPPEPGAKAKKGVREPVAPVVARKGRRPLRTFLVVGGAVLVVAALAAWYLLGSADKLFPNSQPAVALGPGAGGGAAAGAPRADVVARAKKLQAEGKTASAISLLRRIPPSSPQYAAAQPLIQEWEQAGKPAAPEPAAGPDTSRRGQMIALARDAQSAGEYLRSRELLERAAKLGPLDPGEQALREEADRRLEPIERQIQLVRDGEYERALPDLWRAHEAEPGNRDVRTLMVDAYFDMAVRNLQRGNTREATDNLNEALALQPDDELLKRVYRFAQTYTERPPDLLYRTFVKYLPTR